MKNYRFNERAAQSYPPQALLLILIGLIEVQRLANIYRNGAASNLKVCGICGNLDALVPAGSRVFLPWLFFKGTVYPVVPYRSAICDEETEATRTFRWGHNEVGNTRMAMLELMIKDLTNYLQTKA